MSCGPSLLRGLGQRVGVIYVGVIYVGVIYVGVIYVGVIYVGVIYVGIVSSNSSVSPKHARPCPSGFRCSFPQVRNRF